MNDAHNENATNGEPLFSEEEREILDLYDQAQNLELEVALTKARVHLAGSQLLLNIPPNSPFPSRLTKSTADEHARGTRRAPPADDDDEPDAGALQESRAQLLEAVALYRLRNAVTDSVLITNPILKGIHNSAYASPVEQDLPPLVAARDAAAHAAAARSAGLRAALDRLSEAEAEAQRARRRNRELAAEVLRLAAEAGRSREEALAGDERAAAQVAALEARLATSRQKWRVIKGTAAGIVTGSGVDWAADEVLRELVLDPE